MGHYLRLTRGPAGKRTTTGSLSAVQEAAIPTEPRGHLLGNCQGNMPSGPVGATLGGLTLQAAQIQEVMAMLGSLNEGQLQTVQQHMQDRFVTMQQRRGVPKVFGDGLGRALTAPSKCIGHPTG